LLQLTYASFGKTQRLRIYFAFAFKQLLTVDCFPQLIFLLRELVPQIADCHKDLRHICVRDYIDPVFDRTSHLQLQHTDRLENLIQIAHSNFCSNL